MNRSDPDSLDELIADCADIPSSLRTLRDVPPPCAPSRRWEVDEGCLAQINGMDDYI